MKRPDKSGLYLLQPTPGHPLLVGVQPILYNAITCEFRMLCATDTAARAWVPWDRLELAVGMYDAWAPIPQQADWQPLR